MSAYHYFSMVKIKASKALRLTFISRCEVRDALYMCVQLN